MISVIIQEVGVTDSQSLTLKLNRKNRGLTKTIQNTFTESRLALSIGKNKQKTKHLNPAQL